MPKSSQNFDALFSSLAEGLIVVDLEQRITLMNQTAGVLLKIAPAEALKKKVQTVLKVKDEKKKSLSIANLIEKTQKQLTINRFLVSDNITCMDAEGKEFPLGMVITPLLEEEVTGSVITFQDITKEKTIDQAKSEFISFASHQLRTPISTASWYLEILLDEDVGKINKLQHKCLKIVSDSMQNMLELVNTFLNVSRIDLGTLAIKPEPIFIQKIAEQFLSEIDHQIKHKKLRLTTHFDPSIQRINADPKVVRVIFQNLISNAIKYTPSKGKISVSIEKKNREVLITVSDTGFGIPKKDQKNVFSKMFRAKNVENSEIEGNGLGLYIVSSVLMQSNGRIWFQSEINKGTTFFIAIPLSGMNAKKGTRTLD